MRSRLFWWRGRQCLVLQCQEHLHQSRGPGAGEQVTDVRPEPIARAIPRSEFHKARLRPDRPSGPGPMTLD